MPLQIIIYHEDDDCKDGIVQYVFTKGKDGLNQMDIYSDCKKIYGVKFKYVKE